MAFTYAKLRGRIIEKFGSQGAFAYALGVHQNTVCRKLNGKNAFTRDDMLIWAKLLDIASGDIGAYFFE